MAVTLHETHESREVQYGAQGGREPLIFTAIGSTDEAEVYAQAQADTPTHINGFVRQDIRLRPLGGPVWRVEVEYGTTGLGGGDQPTGQTPTNPDGPGDGTPLTSGFSFGIAFNSITLTQSITTISATRRGGGVARDFKQAIGVGLDGRVDGCQVPPTPKMTFQRTVARAVVNMPYLRTIRSLCGRVNNAAFYGQQAGEVLYLGCDGQYTQGEGWSLTHKFGCEENRIAITVCDGLVVPAKLGFHYLWVAYEEVTDLATGLTSSVPFQANVEQVLEEANFALIEIGV
jgi:hypothetical protein